MNGLAGILRRLSNVLVRGRVIKADPSGKIQRLQVMLMANEPKDGLEHFEPYGFTSCPHPGSEHLTSFIDGDRSHGVTVVVTDRRYRLEAMAEGEVAISDDLGQKVHLTRDGITVETAKTLRLVGKDIQLHATNSYSWDVNGFGERWTFSGGTAWLHTTWQTGATVTTVTDPINPPEGP